MWWYHIYINFALKHGDSSHFPSRQCKEPLPNVLLTDPETAFSMQQAATLPLLPAPYTGRKQTCDKREQRGGDDNESSRLMTGRCPKKK
jgi:hypothetical protein